MQSAFPKKSDLFTDFENVDFWIFDLDNTLYPRGLNLTVQMRNKTYDYICQRLNIDRAAAADVYERFEAFYGTSLNGLMIEHKIDPNEFLSYVHDIDHGLLKPDLRLGNAIRDLPGKRVIYTNGTVRHAENVLKRLGITELFEDIFDIVWADLDPKPNRAPFERLFAQTGADPTRAAMFEDTARNLEIPFALGAKTILIRSDSRCDDKHDHAQATHNALGYVDYVTDDLGGFLAGVLDERRKGRTLN